MWPISCDHTGFNYNNALDLMRSEIVAFDSVGFSRGDRHILSGIDLTISRGDRWLVVGGNGSGKSTLLRMMALREHPSSGSIDVFGERLGRIDVRQARRQIGFSAQGLSDQLRVELRAIDVVVTAIHAALEPWWHTYSPAEFALAQQQLDRLHIGELGEQPFGTLSSGERQRVLLARTLMNQPSLIVLDEPFAGLDLVAREDFIDALAMLNRDDDVGALALVTHHLEEVPPGMTHMLCLREGRAVFTGTINEGMTSDVISETFGINIEVTLSDEGRLRAVSRKQN